MKEVFYITICTGVKVYDDKSVSIVTKFFMTFDYKPKQTEILLEQFQVMFPGLNYYYVETRAIEEEVIHEAYMDLGDSNPAKLLKLLKGHYITDKIQKN